MIKEGFRKIKIFSYQGIEYNILLDKVYLKSCSKPYVEAISNLVKKDFVEKWKEKLLVSDSVINTEVDGKSTVIIYSLEENDLLINFTTDDNRLIL